VGDHIVATPFVRNLARNFPGAALDFAASSRTGVDLLRENPYLRDCFVLDMECFRFGGERPVGKKASYLSWLRGRRYDRVYVLSTKPRHAIAAFLAGAPERIGFASRHRQVFLTRHWFEPLEKNVVDRFLDLLRLDGLAVDSNTVEMHLLDAEVAEAERLRGDLFPGSTPVVAVAPFAADMRRTWGLRAFSEMVSRCRDRGIGVAILGSEAERRLMEGGTFPAGNGVASLVGKLSVRQSASLIKASDAFVGNDSGLAHVAGAVGTPGIVIGYHVTRTWYPSSSCIQTIIKVPGCCSCDVSACVGNTGAVPPCFQAVSVAEVMERLLPLLPGRL
jgi:heptosyltransferase-2